MNEQFVQGDVLFERVDICAGDVRLHDPSGRQVKDGRLILARGEKTGHVHTVDAAKVKIGTVGWDDLLLNVHEPVEVAHDEHPALPLEPGMYRVRLQRRYTPQAERRVLD